MFSWIKIIFYYFCLFPMSEDKEVGAEIKENILSSIGVTESNLEQYLSTIRDWIPHQHHFPQVEIEDTLLYSLIVGCKGNVDKAKSKLDGYFTCRAKFPDIFSNRDPLDPDFIRYSKCQPLVTLPGRTKDGCRVHITWLEETDYNVTIWTKRVIAHWEILLRTDPWTAGEIFLVSGTNFSFSHAAKLSPNQLATLFSLAQNVYPLRIRGIWFYSAPPACDFIVNKIIKPIISKKLSERIQVHSEDYGILQKNFPTKMLPEDYGGEASKLSILNERWLGRISKHRSWFLREGVLTTDETKRPSSTVDSFGSVAGSFRKLQID